MKALHFLSDLVIILVTSPFKKKYYYMYLLFLSVLIKTLDKKETVQCNFYSFISSNLGFFFHFISNLSLTFLLSRTFVWGLSNVLFLRHCVLKQNIRGVSYYEALYKDSTEQKDKALRFTINDLCIPCLHYCDMCNCSCNGSQTQVC